MKDESVRMRKQSIPDVRVCVTGGSSVGKSALTVRFLTRRFIGEYQKDVERTYRGLIDFGPDTIRYVFKDTARSPDKNFLTTWPTCIAVIYSINDIASFVIASELLEDIDATSSKSLNCKRCGPSIALIGNKRDLEHLRNVREEDGRKLADKHGATFWEASAADDYDSTFRPLHSLIVLSFLNSKKRPTSSLVSTSPSSSSGSEDKTSNVTLTTRNDIEMQKVLRRNSEPCYNAARIITSSKLVANYLRKHSDDAVTRNRTNSNPCRNSSIKRKKSNLREVKSKSFDRGASPRSATPTTPRSTTPTTPRSTIPTTPPPQDSEISNGNYMYNNITIEVTDTSNELPCRRSLRSQSFTKGDKKPSSIQRKSTRQKQHHSLTSDVKGLAKSRSYTDLKSLQLPKFEQVRKIISAKSEMSLAIEDDLNRNAMDHFNDEENLKETVRSISTSNISKIENGRNYWNIIRKDRRKLLEKMCVHNNEGNEGIGKKSVRSRISSMFRPRSVSDTMSPSNC